MASASRVSNPTFKPTRRETMKVVFDEMHRRANKRFEAAVAENERLRREALTAQRQVAAIADEYGKKKYKKLVDKITKLLNDEFPDSNVLLNVTLNNAVDNSDNLSLTDAQKLAGQTARVSLTTSVCQPSSILPLTPEVRSKMLTAAEEAVRLNGEYRASQARLQNLKRQTRKSQTADCQQLLGSLIPSMGAEAVAHLDALVDLMEKTLAAKIEEQT